MSAPEPLKVEPDAPPAPPLLNVTAFVTEPAEPVIEALSDEVETAYREPLLPPMRPLSDATEIVFENLLSTPENVFESPKRVEDAAVPEAPLIVMGLAPMAVNEVQLTLPLHVTLVVATLANVFTPEKYGKLPNTA